uniref:(northern house mosquito) hypothetical protein n=1 Tax=Culex pipiens TaxID=7175 RepID=A0A8D8HJG9_CULPI
MLLQRRIRLQSSAPSSVPLPTANQPARTSQMDSNPIVPQPAAATASQTANSPTLQLSPPGPKTSHNTRSRPPSTKHCAGFHRYPLPSLEPPKPGRTWPSAS